MQRNYFSILFFIKKTKLLKNGEAPICLRITVNGKRVEIQVRRSILIEMWDNKKECAIGGNRKEMEINHYLETVRTKLLDIHRRLEQDNKHITAEILKQHYCGRMDTHKMLLVIFEEHNKKCRELLGKEYVLGSVLRYERTARYLAEYMKLKYGLLDMPMKEIDNSFVLNFEHFIKVNKACAQNATVKYLKILKRIVRYALACK